MQSVFFVVEKKTCRFTKNDRSDKVALLALYPGVRFLKPGKCTGETALQIVSGRSGNRLIDLNIAGRQQTHGIFAAAIGNQNTDMIVNHQLGSPNTCALTCGKGGFQKMKVVCLRIEEQKIP